MPEHLPAGAVPTRGQTDAAGLCAAPGARHRLRGKRRAAAALLRASGVPRIVHARLKTPSARRPGRSPPGPLPVVCATILSGWASIVRRGRLGLRDSWIGRGLHRNRPRGRDDVPDGTLLCDQGTRTREFLIDSPRRHNPDPGTDSNSRTRHARPRARAAADDRVATRRRACGPLFFGILRALSFLTRVSWGRCVPAHRSYDRSRAQILSGIARGRQAMALSHCRRCVLGNTRSPAPLTQLSTTAAADETSGCSRDDRRVDRRALVLVRRHDRLILT